MANSDQDFDGYRKWLGITNPKRPPTHYDLLKVSLDEDDDEVIKAAAEQRRHYVESKRGQGQDGIVGEIIYAISEAEITLLNVEMRREYDRQQDLFRKRRKNRQVDPSAAPIRFKSRSGRIVGEDNGVVKTFAGIVAIICVAFGTMAWFSFQLPWSRPINRVNAAQDVQELAPAQAQVAEPEDRELEAAQTNAKPIKKPAEEPIEREKAAGNSALDGEWLFVEGIRSGQPINNDDHSRRMVIKGEKYLLFSGLTALEGTLRVDDTQSPKHFDLVPEKGGIADLAGKIKRGIYELNDSGKTLRFCIGTPEGDRPEKYDGKPEGWSVQVYRKRRKDGDETTVDSKGGSTKALSPLQGTWLATAEEANGKRVKKDEMKAKKKTLKVDGDKFTISTSNYKVIGNVRVVPDDGPNAIDLKGKFVEGGSGQSILLRGIFEIKDTTLRLCYSYSDSKKDRKRPSEFETEEGTEDVFVTFERAELGNKK